MQFCKPVFLSLLSLLSAHILLATPSWENLGGSFQGKPSAAFSADGRLEVFVRGNDNALWFAAQTSPGGSWTPFVSLGGVIISDPTAVQEEVGGTISVFALGTDNAVWTRSQTQSGIDNYSDWTSIGGIGASDLAVAETFADLHHPFSEVLLYMRGADNTLWSNRQTNASIWSGWGSGSGYLTSAPGAALLPNENSDVFVRGGDNGLWRQYGGGWVTLGGAMNGPPVVAQINGSVTYRGLDNAAWFSLYNGTSWAEPVSLGGYIISNPTMAYCDPRIPGCGDPNNLEVFAVGGDNALWVTVSQGSPFGPWQSLGGSIAGDPFAFLTRDGTIEVFAIGPDGTLSHIRQSAPGSWQ